jgi:beta-galactosidase
LVEPGFLGAITRQELAHGARSVLYFSWRVFPSGVEFMLSGVLPSDSKPRRTYREITDIISDSKALEPALEGLLPAADVAILRDFDCDWALDDGLPHPDFRYLRHLHRYSQALFENHVNVDILSPEDDFSGHKILVAPSWILIDEARAVKLTDFVKNGGTLVLTCLSAMRDPDNRNRPETIPSLLTGLCGIEVEEQQPLKFQDKVRFRDASREAHEGAYWFDLLSLHGAEPLATYDDRWFSGVPAVTRHRNGKGTVIYVGTVPDVPYLRSLLSGICTEAGIYPNVTDPSSPLIESVKVFRSEDRSGEYLHLINFTGKEQQVTLPAPHDSLPDFNRLDGRISLPPFGSLFLQKIA